jgi:hypothetical protein
MKDAGFIVGAYAITAVVIGAYIVAMVRKARALGATVPPEDRPWT